MHGAIIALSGIGFYRIDLVWNVFLIIYQEPDAFNKTLFGDHHHQIDSVEVFLATKASGEISFRINRRVKFVA